MTFLNLRVLLNLGMKLLMALLSSFGFDGL